MKSQLVREEGLTPQNDFYFEENPVSWINLIETLLQDHNYRKAEDCIRMALSMSPHCEKLWLKLGKLLQELNQSSEAEKCFSEAIKLNPSNEIAQNYLKRLTKNF